MKYFCANILIYFGTIQLLLPDIYLTSESIVGVLFVFYLTVGGRVGRRNFPFSLSQNRA